MTEDSDVTRPAALRQALIEGDNSGEAEELDMRTIKARARQRSGPLMREVILSHLAERDPFGISQYSRAQTGRGAG